MFFSANNIKYLEVSKSNWPIKTHSEILK